MSSLSQASSWAVSYCSPLPSSRILMGVVSTHLRSKGQDFPLAYPKILIIEIIAPG